MVCLVGLLISVHMVLDGGPGSCKPLPSSGVCKATRHLMMVALPLTRFFPQILNSVIL